MEYSVLTSALKPLEVDRTTISFSVLCWADSTPGQDSRNQTRKAGVSRAPEIKVVVLLG